MFNAFVYILASERNGTLYIGVTTNLPKRIWEHPTSVVDGFTTKYNVKTLVWYEVHDSIEGARLREKQLKKWRRSWKLQLIEDSNPLGGICIMTSPSPEPYEELGPRVRGDDDNFLVIMPYAPLLFFSVSSVISNEFLLSTSMGP